MSNDHFLWVEKYRPKTIDECILPESLKATFKKFIEGGELPTFLFCGGAGVGKTTVAKALCNEVGAEFMFINGSEENGIDVLRTKIRELPRLLVSSPRPKSSSSMKPTTLPSRSNQVCALFIEEFSNNCRFIFTCNFKHKIIEPLHSRCAVIDFKIPSAEKPAVAEGFFKRVLQILKEEGISCDKKAVAKLVESHFPDFRRVLNELQRYSIHGSIDEGILINLSDQSFKELIGYLKEKNFTDARKWVARNSDIEPVQLFSRLYDSAVDNLDGGSVPQLVLILADYQYKAAFVANAELNVVAALTEIMANCKFK